MLSSTTTSTLRGIDGQRVRVEVHVGSGMPSFNVVGLPDTSCREARDRVRAAINTSKLRWPVGRITVNLAPSNVPKHGSGLDLAIAMGVLAASDPRLDPRSIADIGFIAELGLDGSLRSVPGMLSRASVISDRPVVVAPNAVAQARLAGVETVRSAKNLAEVVLAVAELAPWPDPELDLAERVYEPEPLCDLADISGHPMARKALEVAAAGGHNLLLIGPPGAGKSMLAKRLPSILPELDDKTALLTSRVHSVAGIGLPPTRLCTIPPFRAPHHSISLAALIGGGSNRFRPGEISCAHGGVLFLDELGEYSARALDAMRQPLEEGSVHIARAHGSCRFPARFMLVAAMNPCPCGFLGSGDPCRCTESERRRYMRRLSGPLLDRIDIRVHMQRPKASDLLDNRGGEASFGVKERVELARKRAWQRGVSSNSQLSGDDLDECTELDTESQKLIRSALCDGRLSGRGLTRVRCVSRTIADLAERENIESQDVAMALALRERPALFEAAGL